MVKQSLGTAQIWLCQAVSCILLHCHLPISRLLFSQLVTQMNKILLCSNCAEEVSLYHPERVQNVEQDSRHEALAHRCLWRRMFNHRKSTKP